MKDEQFEILVSLINETKDELKQTKEELEAEIKQTKKDLEDELKQTRLELHNSLKDSEIKIILMINEVRKDLEKNMRINGREHQTLIDTIEKRYDDLEEAITFIQDDIRTLHALSKKNEMEHKEYDRILVQNNLK